MNGTMNNKEKEKEIEKINQCITELVYDKVALRKAYNYYHGIRDAEQFRHLEENYGVGVPTSVMFTPLMKKHIDVLVGEYLELEPDMKVTCKDDETCSKIQRDKQLKIDAEIYKYIQKYLQNAIINILLGSQEPTNDPFLEKELERIKIDIENSYESDYEIAAQNIIEYIKHNRDLDLKNKLRELLIDLFVGGTIYWRTKPSGGKDNLRFDVLNPLDTFIERNPNSFFLNKSRRAVIRRWLTKTEIFEEYGEDLSNEAISKIDDYFTGEEKTALGSEFVLINTPDSILENGDHGKTPGLLAGLEAHPLYPFDKMNENRWSLSRRLIPVYECQWLEFDKKKNRTILHEGVKIGEDVYITNGEPDYYIKSKTDPRSCQLNINGLFFNDKNGQPFSLIASTIDLQDRYDMLQYSRDALIASSGTVGDWIDLAALPAVLGAEMPERVMKWLAYKKNGVALYDSSQEGAQLMNTTFNGYDDTIKGQAIQAIQIAIDAIEAQASAISGVYPQKLGQIQEREAASNVKVGIHQSSLVTKQYFYMMDLVQREIFYDLLNLSKFVFKNGLTGTIILGDRLVKTFTALPEHFTMTDFDIHLADSAESYQMMQESKQLNFELIKANQVDAEMALEIMTAKNATQLKRRLDRAIKTKKAENNMINQLQQQVQQYDSQIKQDQKTIADLQNEIKRLQSQVEANTQAQIELDAKRVEIEEKEARDKKDFNDKTIEVKEKQLEAEIMQMWDGNPYNNEVRNV